MPFPGYSPEGIPDNQTGENSAIPVQIMWSHLHPSADIEETAPASSITLFFVKRNDKYYILIVTTIVCNNYKGEERKMVTNETFRAIRKMYEFLRDAEEEGFLDSLTNMNNMHPREMEELYENIMESSEKIFEDACHGELTN